MDATARTVSNGGNGMIAFIIGLVVGILIGEIVAAIAIAMFSGGDA